MNVPFALIGGIFALLLTGIPLSVSAAIGFIALFGQAVLNGVVMVSYFNQLRDAGDNCSSAVMQGCARAPADGDDDGAAGDAWACCRWRFRTASAPKPKSRSPS